jgi:hypothetical protein
MASPARELAPQLKGNESLIAQLEAVRLNGVHNNSTTENLVEMVHKLSEEVSLLRKDNEYLKMKMESMCAGFVATTGCDVIGSSQGQST